MKRRYYLLLIACVLAVAGGYFAYDIAMRTRMELLWGWRPFGLLLTIWGALIMVVSARMEAPSHRRWLVLSSLCGLLLGVSFPPSPMVPLVFVAIVPLLVLEDEVAQERGVARWTVFRYAFNAFFIWNIVTTWWIINTSFVPGIVANATNALLMAAVFTVYHQLRVVLGQRLHLLLLVALWVGFEYLHLHWDISWPWLHLGHYFAQYPSWVQWYEYTGVFGGTVWVLLLNYLIWEIYRARISGDSPATSRIGFIAALIIAPIAFGLFRYYTYDQPEEAVEVAVIQPNFEPHYEKFSYSQRRQLGRFLELSLSVTGPETRYLVFPETSLGLVELNSIEDDYRIEALRQLHDTFPALNIVTGLESYRRHDAFIDIPAIRAQVRGRDTLWFDVQNSAVQLSRDRPAEVYFKSKLVPGAEFMPFGANLPFIKPLILMLQGSVSGVTRQPEREVFFNDETGVAPIICYESVYGDYVGDYVRRGADLLFIVTNDGWWDDTPGHIQHLKLATLRAIEHRKWIARSANTGISCFINSRGDILQATDYGETTAVLGMVGLDDTRTFYTIWGDVIARLCAFMAVIFVIVGFVQGWKSYLERR